MQKICVRDLMTAPVVVIDPAARLPTASALMKEHRIRHLPVVENERLVGIISRGDLREASITANLNADAYELHFMLSRLTVGKLMTRRVFTVTADAPIVHVAELMTEHKISGLPVIDDGSHVVGIITESDLLRMLAQTLRQSDEGTV